ncbi:Uncharacterized protein HZ326_25878 [Fusarium oxysporum f. sp. albedinis]|nr:Uncharacterized protein HZ326_25878 [Fusarium oxysporum f. sp. albedinis]
MDAFVFVTSTGRPGQAESEVDRHRIRRHAMCGMAIARRAKGDYGQHNRRQLPLFLEPTASTVKENTSPQQELFNSALEVASMVRSPLSAQGYELAKLTYARAHHSLHPDSGISETAVIKLYLKALSQLQEALGDKLETMGACRCAMCDQNTRFLQFSESAQWLNHITGARKLMKLRGPENYSTDLEQQMLMSQTGTIFHESMSIGEDCFLEELKWKALLSSIAAVERPTNMIKSLDCHPVLSSLWIHASPAARLFRQTSVCVNGMGANDSGTILQLILEAHQTRQNLLTRREDFTKFAAELQRDQHRSRLRELLGVSFAVQIVLNRLIVALQPRAAEARTLENETQAFADRIIVLCHEAKEESLPISNMLLAKKIVIANATKESEDDWMWAVSGETYSTCQGIQRIPATIFEKWYIALGRQHVD